MLFDSLFAGKEVIEKSSATDSSPPSGTADHCRHSFSGHSPDLIAECEGPPPRADTVAIPDSVGEDPERVQKTARNIIGADQLVDVEDVGEVSFRRCENGKETTVESVSTVSDGVQRNLHGDESVTDSVLRRFNEDTCICEEDKSTVDPFEAVENDADKVFSTAVTGGVVSHRDEGKHEAAGFADTAEERFSSDFGDDDNSENDGRQTIESDYPFLESPEVFPYFKGHLSVNFSCLFYFA